ncbi:hypothetical protein DCCM_2408 [Desulfocucumis palustris]|uniref:DUF1468 domain-containing protein n=1 Tax=Desulfocucumis palustris TaxID=1898651 RepID=A0A2L2XAL7_9FIRM|nr:tripartite tricarboxylate transporter TctB family protein [Desulfocucumis palustris]GBF33309.1 hypothetical protein DCCM_2408 [Desulfocucumis palustris]
MIISENTVYGWKNGSYFKKYPVFSWKHNWNRGGDSMRTANFGLSIIIFIVSIFLFVKTSSFPPSLQSGLPGPDFWPKFLLILLMCFCFLLFIITLREPEQKIDWQLKGIYKYIVLTAVYLVAMRPLGFLAATLLFVPIMLYLLGMRKWHLIVMVPLLFVAGVYLILEVLLGVTLV